MSAAAMLGSRPVPAVAEAVWPSSPTDDQRAWIADVGRAFAGQRVRMVSEWTPPSRVLKDVLAREFTELTGIQVEIELLTLERVLQRIAADAAADVARYDVLYLDQGWMARFAETTIDCRERWPQGHEFAMPGYDWDDFLPTLVDGVASHRGKLVGVPFDIPIFVMLCRQDLLDRLGLPLPTDLESYAETIEAVQAEFGPEVYGSTGQCKRGHYSLTCEWTAWLWAHGGSVFDVEGRFAGGDAQGIEGLDYLRRLQRSMPPQVTQWTWDGQTQSIRLGLAATALTWGENFPTFDDPARSRVSGLMTASPPPRPKALRSPEDCAFGEIPNIGHQGGSALALAGNSARPEASWIFLQWATSADTQARASVLGNGASPTRASVFDDPRVLDARKVGAGTTRHLDAVRQTIETAMGSEPDLETWPDLANGVIPDELGALLEDHSLYPEGAMNRIADAVRRAVEA